MRCSIIYSNGTGVKLRFYLNITRIWEAVDFVYTGLYFYLQRN